MTKQEKTRMRRDFVRVGRYERSFKPGAYGRIVKGLVLSEPNFAPRYQQLQWILFPRFV